MKKIQEIFKDLKPESQSTKLATATVLYIALVVFVNGFKTLGTEVAEHGDFNTTWESFKHAFFRTEIIGVAVSVSTSDMFTLFWSGLRENYANKITMFSDGYSWIKDKITNFCSKDDDEPLLNDVNNFNPKDINNDDSPLLARQNNKHLCNNL